MEHLLVLARECGVGIAWSAALGEHARGFYEHDRRRIILSTAMTVPQARAALAHELGHAHYAHRRTGNGPVDAAAERLADIYAAELLICAREYAAAERLVGAHPGALARELGVTADLVRCWQRACHDGRIGMP